MKCYIHFYQKEQSKRYTTIKLCHSYNSNGKDFPPSNKTSWWRRNDVSLYVPSTSQVLHKWNTQRRLDETSLRRYWNFVTTSQEYIKTTSHQYVSTTSQANLKWNTQGRFSGKSRRRLSGTYLRRPISASLRRLLQVPNETLNNVAVVRLHHVSEYVVVTLC